MTNYQLHLSRIFYQPLYPCLQTFARAAGEWESGDVGVEDLHALCEVIHAEIDVGQQVDLVDDERIHAAIGAGIFIGLVVAFGHRCNEDSLMRAEFEVRRADEIANILNNEQIELRQVELIERAAQQNRIKMTIAAGDDLN